MWLQHAVLPIWQPGKLFYFVFEFLSDNIYKHKSKGHKLQKTYDSLEMPFDFYTTKRIWSSIEHWKQCVFRQIRINPILHKASFLNFFLNWLISHFYCRSYSMDAGISNSTVEVTIVLGRRLVNSIMTVYMPTILLNIIGHSTNFFKSESFDAGAAVNLMVI